MELIYLPRIRKLIETLRSGKYEQGEGVLRSDGNKFCCLGVAEDIRGCKWTDKADARTSTGYLCFEVLPDKNTFALSLEGMQFYGFTDSEGAFVYNEEIENIIEVVSSLAALNDDGYEFGVIADVIALCLNDPDTEMFSPIVYKEVEQEKLANG
jgi:hypothetical protein